MAGWRPKMRIVTEQLWVGLKYHLALAQFPADCLQLGSRFESDKEEAS
jgi:hypothetical protein